MAIRVIWSQPALEDFDDILAVIARDKPRAAKALGKRVLEAARRLARFPALGRWVPELKPSAYREILLAPVRVIYRREKDTIIIVHVVRQERTIDSPS